MAVYVNCDWPQSKKNWTDRTMPRQELQNAHGKFLLLGLLITIRMMMMMVLEETKKKKKQQQQQ